MRSRGSLVVLFLALAACSGGTDRPAPRHVVFLTLDTTRADHFGFMGNRRVRTPRLDALAAESIVLEACATVVPTTLASHTSLFTGKYPHHHGTARNGFVVHRDNEMLAEILQGAGFETAGFIGSFALERRFDFAQGFRHWDETFEQWFGQDGADQNQRAAASLTDAVLRHLDGAGVPDRLFLFVQYFDPHRPYAAPPPYDTAYDAEGRRGLPPVQALRRDASLPETERTRLARRMESQYAAEISYTDHHVGRLLDGLRKRGVLESAVLVVTSDHGESLWEHDELFDHGRTVYQATMHVVGLIRLPGGELGGTRVDRPVANIDLMPTVLELLDIPLPQAMDGRPLALVDLASPGLPRPVFGQATIPWRQVETDPRWTNILKSRYVREGRYKLIQTPYLGTEELYDLEADPRETVNLLRRPAPESLEVAERLRGRLESWAASADPLPSHFDRSQHDETVERLRSLGYVQEAEPRGRDLKAPAR